MNSGCTELLGAEVRPVEGKGLGIVATREILKGDRILLERPFLMVAAADLEKWTVQLNLFRETCRAVQEVEEYLRSVIGRAGVADEFSRLCDAYVSDGCKTAAGTLLSNSLSAGPSLADSALLALGSRFNHSCCPNACYSWQNTAGQLLFHATRDIASGEEVTISYVPLYRSSQERVMELSMRYRFQCRCSGCEARGRLLAGSDRRRARMRELELELSVVPVADEELPEVCAKVWQLVEELVGLIDLEFDGNTKLKARTYCAALQLLLECEAVPAEDAERLLELAQQQATLAVGAEGEWSPSLVMSFDASEDAEHAEPVASATAVDHSDDGRTAEFLKEQFRHQRGVGTGTQIDLQEFSELLLRGRPSMPQHYVRAVFNAVDSTGFGTVEFDHLVDFLYDIPSGQRATGPTVSKAGSLAVS